MTKLEKSQKEFLAKRAKYASTPKTKITISCTGNGLTQQIVDALSNGKLTLKDF